MDIALSTANGECDPADSIITWDVPYCPHDPKKTNKLRMKRELPPLDARVSNQKIDDLIQRIIPPGEWVEDGTRWIQPPSSQPALRLDVVNLRDKLHRRLDECGARRTGHSEPRRELYDECFDEIIRQVVADNDVERGLLLLRVRDERRQTLHAYQTLFESRTAYGFRVALNGEQQLMQEKQKMVHIRQHVKQLEQQAQELQAAIEQTVKQQEERTREDEKRYADEINTLKKENTAKKQQLENLCIKK